jgi:hypothetical protein
MDIKESLFLSNKPVKFNESQLQTHIFGSGCDTKVYIKINCPILNKSGHICIKCYKKTLGTFYDAKLCPKCILEIKTLNHTTIEEYGMINQVFSSIDKTIIINKMGVNIINVIPDNNEQINPDYKTLRNRCFNKSCLLGKFTEIYICKSCQNVILTRLFKKNIPYLLFIRDCELIEDVKNIIKDYYLILSFINK